MFYWKEDRDEVNDITEEVAFLQLRVSTQADIIDDLAARLDRYEQILLKVGQHGYKKDGTPKAKPGRKVGS